MSIYVRIHIIIIQVCTRTLCRIHKLYRLSGCAYASICVRYVHSMCTVCVCMHVWVYACTHDLCVLMYSILCYV